MRQLLLALIALSGRMQLYGLQVQGQPERAKTLADAELARQLSAVVCRVDLPFEYAVDHGAVRLSGRVNTRAQRRAIVQEVEHMGGVKHVTDRITISRIWVGAGCGFRIGVGADVGYGPPTSPQQLH